jgi:hypothetical protein
LHAGMLGRGQSTFSICSPVISHVCYSSGCARPRGDSHQLRVPL